MPRTKRSKVDKSSESAESTDDLRVTISRLQAELDSERQSTKQLRREKAYEVQQARADEAGRSAVALTDLGARLHRERQQELDSLRESLRCRHEADVGKVTKQKDQELRKLKQDLARCQHELEEEVEKRGLSTSARKSFELERSKLFQDLKEVNASRKQLEESLRTAEEANKQKNAEIRQLNETCRLEVCRVSKEATQEARKLLDELKAKDHLLALIDRNQYPDKSSLLKLKSQHDPSKRSQDENSSEKCTTKAASPMVDESYYKSQIERLTEQVKSLKREKESAASERDALRRQVADHRQPVITLVSCQKNRRSVEETTDEERNKLQPKAVRFLLPGETLPVVGGVQDVDEGEDNHSESSETTCLSSLNDDSELCCHEVNVKKNYQLLMREHLHLERAHSTLQSLTPSMRCRAIEHLKEQLIQKESLSLTLWALNEKLDSYERRENELLVQLDELKEQNEELEFQVLEHQDASDKSVLKLDGRDGDEGCQLNPNLELELLNLRARLLEYETVELELSESGLSVEQYVSNLREKCTKQELELVQLTHEVLKLGSGPDEDETREGASPGQHSSTDVPMLRSNLSQMSDSWSMNDDICMMTCSVSTETSGFDDVSCLSLDVMSDISHSEIPEFSAPSSTDDQLQGELVPPQTSTSIEGSLPEINVTTGEVPVLETEENLKEECLESPISKSSEERLWMRRAEVLEQRLKESVYNERRAQDQLALLGEETNRRIKALQFQIDVLEDNEFRLNDVIGTLDEMDRQLQRRLSQTTGLDFDAGCVDQAVQLIACDGQSESDNSEMSDQVLVELKRTMDMLESDQKLWNASLSQTSDLEQKMCEIFIKNTKQEDFEIPITKITSGVLKSKMAEISTGYSEIKQIIRELSCSHFDLQLQDGRQPIAAMPALELDLNSKWSCQFDETSLPSDLTSDRVTTILSQKNYELELTEHHLRQQVEDIEREYKNLLSVNTKHQSTISELRTQTSDLKTSKRHLQDEVGRLRMSIEQRDVKIEELIDEISRYETIVKNLETTESQLKSQIQNYRNTESNLRLNLENTEEEMRNREYCLMKQVSELKDEVKRLNERRDELAERIVDLEDAEHALKLKIKKLESTQSATEKRLEELELVVVEKDNLTTELELEKENLCERLHQLEISQLALSSQMSDIQTENETKCQELGSLMEKISNLNVLLETKEAALIVMQSKLDECSTSEENLKKLLSESDQMEESLRERIKALEVEEVKTIARLDKMTAEQVLQKLGGLYHKDKMRSENEYWAMVEDPCVVYDVRAAEHSEYWQYVEALMAKSKDFEQPKTNESLNIATSSLYYKQTTANKKSDETKVAEEDSNPSPPPPLPRSLPPTPRPDSLKRYDYAESIDDASEIVDEDDGGLLQTSSLRSTPNIWNSSPRVATPRPQSADLTSGLWKRLAYATAERASLVDRSETIQTGFDEEDELAESESPPWRASSVGSTPKRADSMESVTDSGLESMKRDEESWIEKSPAPPRTVTRLPMSLVLNREVHRGHDDGTTRTTRWSISSPPEGARSTHQVYRGRSYYREINQCPTQSLLGVDPQSLSTSSEQSSKPVHRTSLIPLSKRHSVNGSLQFTSTSPSLSPTSPGVSLLARLGTSLQQPRDTVTSPCSPSEPGRRPLPPSLLPRPVAAADSKGNYRAVRDYRPSQFSQSGRVQMELPLKEGDILRTFGSVDDKGYIEAEVNGKVGLIPVNYILPIVQRTVSRTIANDGSIGYNRQHVGRLSSQYVNTVFNVGPSSLQGPVLHASTNSFQSS